MAHPRRHEQAVVFLSALIALLLEGHDGVEVIYGELRRKQLIRK